MKIELQSVNFDEMNWKFAFDNIHRDAKINYSREDAYSFESNYSADHIKIMQKIGESKHITRRFT